MSVLGRLCDCGHTNRHHYAAGTDMQNRVGPCKLCPCTAFRQSVSPAPGGAPVNCNHPVYATTRRNGRDHCLKCNSPIGPGGGGT